MFSTTFKRPFVTAAVVGGLLIAAAPASAGSHQAATDGTSNTLINSVVGDSHRGQVPTGFSWSETQTGSAKTAGVHDSGADARGFLVDGPYSVKPASSFSWSETQTGSAMTASVQRGGAEASGFLVDGPFSLKPASGFSWSETQTKLCQQRRQADCDKNTHAKALNTALSDQAGATASTRRRAAATASRAASRGSDPTYLRAASPLGSPRG